MVKKIRINKKRSKPVKLHYTHERLF